MIGYTDVKPVSQLTLEEIEDYRDVPRSVLWGFKFDTHDIARIKKVSEAKIYNDLASGWHRGEIHG